MLKNECIKAHICLKQRKKMGERSKRIKYRWTYSLRKKERKRRKKGRVILYLDGTLDLFYKRDPGQQRTAAAAGRLSIYTRRYLQSLLLRGFLVEPLSK